MDREKIKDILDKSKISAIDEINILEYIDELEQVKEEYIKSLDKLDIYENRIAKAIEYIESNEKEYGSLEENEKIILDILKGEDIKEIPQFEGTLEQLEKLSINGEDNE